ncbi:MAG: AmmeMemoRadiSam system protein A [Candidatus Aureabacteria bacterium]|nr:AmmeMemoRadiSam system protein A [Candidatus Auribacterota bacterium]
MLNAAQQKELLRIARESLTFYLEQGNMKSFSVDDEILQQKQGAFVTLKNKGALRGCIGYIVAVKPLYETVAEMAVNAGTKDTRFHSVTLEEMKDITIEITVLTPFQKIKSVDEIEVGKHGLYIKMGFYSGLLLPQVATEYGWDRDEFLKHVCFKAGLPGDAWKKGAEIYLFSGQVFGEEEEK